MLIFRLLYSFLKCENFNQFQFFTWLASGWHYILFWISIITNTLDILGMGLCRFRSLKQNTIGMIWWWSWIFKWVWFLSNLILKVSTPISPHQFNPIQSNSNPNQTYQNEPSVWIGFQDCIFFWLVVYKGKIVWYALNQEKRKKKNSIKSNLVSIVQSVDTR